MASKLSSTELYQLTMNGLSKLSQGHYSESIDTFQFILTVGDKLSPSYLASLSNLAYVYTMQKKYKKALKLLSKALSFKSVPVTYKIGLLINLASAFSYTQSHKIALKYLYKALTIADPLKFFEMRSVIFFNIAVEYMLLKKAKKALHYFQLGWNFSQTEPNAFYISKLLLEGCSACFPEIYLKPDHKRTISQNTSAKLSELAPKPLKMTLNSASLRSIKKDFTKSLISDCSSTKLGESHSIISIKTEVNQQFEYKKRVKKVKNEINECLEAVNNFFHRGKLALSAVFGELDSYYNRNIQSILKIQRFYRTKIAKKRIKCFKIKDITFLKTLAVPKSKINPKILKNILSKNK